MKSSASRIILILTIVLGIIIPSLASATVVSIKKDADGVTFTLDKGVLKVKVCSENIVEVKYTTLQSFKAKTSLVINNEWKTAAKFSVSENKEEIIISTASLKIWVNRGNNAIKFTDLKGIIILAEDGGNGKTMIETTIAGIPVNNCITQFISPADEALLGLGCHPEDTLSINYKGRNQEMLIKYMTGAIPVLLSNKGYGLLWDNYSPSYFYGAEAGNTRFKYMSENGNMMAKAGNLTSILWDNVMTHTFDNYYDAHSPKARKMYWDQARDSLIVPQDVKTKSILLNYDNLRYRLLPYIYSLAWKVTSEGYTLMRSLAFDFRDDPEIYSIPDQYMFGPAFLVNPVTGRTEKTRKVYLPKSIIWFDFWTGQSLAGGQTIDAPAPVETIPLFIRAGSIVPMGPYLQFATEKPADPLELRIYPGANGNFVLYEDENDTYNYEKGVFSTIAFKWNDAKHKLTIGKRTGTFPGMAEKRTFQIIIVDKNKGTGTEISGKPDKTVNYSGAEQIIQL